MRRSPSSEEEFVVDGGVAAMIFSMENASFLMRGSDEEVFVRSSLSDFSKESSSLDVDVMVEGLETLQVVFILLSPEQYHSL